MEAFTIEPELLLALALVVAFALGWMAQRFVNARSDRQHFELLNVQIARIEKQRDAAHRVALDLSASYTDMVKEQQDTEARMNRIQADLSGRYAKRPRCSPASSRSRSRATRRARGSSRV